MTVSALNALIPTSRPTPERASRAQEERDFARVLDEAEARDAPPEAEEAETEEVETAEAETPESAPARSDALAMSAAVPSIPGETAGLPAAAASLLVAALPAPEPAAAPAPAEPVADAAQAAPEADALQSQAAATQGVPNAAAAEAGPDAAAQAPQEFGEDEARERPLAERHEGDAEFDSTPWTPPGPAKQAAGAAAAAPAAGDGGATPPEGDGLAAVKVLRHAPSEASPIEMRTGPAPAQAPQTTAAPPPSSAAAVSFEAQMKVADGDGSGAAQQAATPRPSVPAAPAAQVAVHIARAFDDGVRRLEVRLNPAELGRVEVKLDVANDGRVIAVVSAERQETLDLLQRDSRSLERGLQDAGIRADSGSLNFTLRQQERQAWSGGGGGAERRIGAADREVSPQGAAAAAFRPRAALRALDISV